jgi:hypothetical protein
LIRWWPSLLPQTSSGLVDTWYGIRLLGCSIIPIRKQAGEFARNSMRFARGGAPIFSEVQKTVRELWEGKLKGSEAQIVANGLSLQVDRQEEGHVDSSQVLFNVNWESGYIWARPRDLGDDVWLSLLQYSRQLAVCANKENGCPGPYFIKMRPNQKFCSEVCAAPAQRAFKRQWFQEHGEEWRKKWLKKKRSAKKSKGEK